MESNGQLFLDNIHSFIESNKILNLLYTFFIYIELCVLWNYNDANILWFRIPFIL